MATALDPTILIVDEVLAVGDQKFRTKCANRIDELKEKCSIILVSHNMEHIDLGSSSSWETNIQRAPFFSQYYTTRTVGITGGTSVCE